MMGIDMTRSPLSLVASSIAPAAARRFSIVEGHGTGRTRPAPMFGTGQTDEPRGAVFVDVHAPRLTPLRPEISFRGSDYSSAMDCRLPGSRPKARPLFDRAGRQRQVDRGEHPVIRIDVLRPGRQPARRSDERQQRAGIRCAQRRVGAAKVVASVVVIEGSVTSWF